jgi:catechol 2,3-dioxygenase-like lactoylglutathione lyase family enzyme
MENAMPDPAFVLLYVADAVASATFYSDLLGRKPVESSPSFAMFVLERDVKLGLWSRDTVEPPATMTGGGAELAIAMPDADAVRATHADWSRRKLAIIQEPTRMEFGLTFVAVDPDGHRLRVYAPVSP